MVAMSATQKVYAQLAFELWDDPRPRVAVAGRRRRRITFAYSNKNQRRRQLRMSFRGRLGAELPQAEVWLNTGWDSHDEDTDLFFGSFGFKTYLHEVGHTLGLTHPGPYDASDDRARLTTPSRLRAGHPEIPVMSYFEADADGSPTDHVGSDGNWKYASTPLLHDIAAMQAIYGVDMTTRTGDTVYGFYSNAGKTIGSFTTTPTTSRTTPTRSFASGTPAARRTRSMPACTGPTSASLSNKARIRRSAA